jgi:hypothetical protein
VNPDEVDDPLDYLLYLRQTGQREEAAEFTRYLTETNQFDAGTIARQMEYREGRMAPRMERENTNEREQLAAEPASYAQQALGGVAGLIKDIPGAEAVAAGGRAFRNLRHGQPANYGEELEDIRSGYEAAPKLGRRINRTIGGAIAGAAIPFKSPALAGGTYGAALNLAQADPDAGLTERAAEGALGFGVGAATGKMADVLSTGTRALFTKPGDAQIGALKAARDKIADPLYKEAIDQGMQGNTNTPAIQQFLQEPDIVPIVERLSSMRQYQGMAPTDPRILDAIRKALTDQGEAAALPLAGYNPSSPNLAREGVENIGRAKDQFAQAVSRDLDAPMPAYEAATSAYHQASRPVDAMLRGEAAMKLGSSNAGNLERLATEGPRGLTEWLRAGNQDMAGPAAQGALATIRRGGGNMGVTGAGNPLQVRTRNMMWNGGDVLRGIEGTAAENAAKPLSAPTLLDYLTRMSATAATPNRGQ